MRRTVALLATLLASSSAVAQPGVTPVQNPDDEQPAQRAPVRPTYAQPTYAQPTYAYEVPSPYAAPQVPDQKGEGTALALSLGGAVAGYAMLGASSDGGRNSSGLALAGALTILIGPSAGHIYAGETGHAVKMSLLRTAGVVTFFAGLIRSSTFVASDCIDCNNHSSSNSREHAGTMMLVGGVTFVVATVYDVIDAPGAARRHNNKNNRALMMVPSYLPTANGGGTPGVALGGRF